MREINANLYRVDLAPDDVTEYVVAKNFADAVEAAEEISANFVGCSVKSIVKLSYHVYRI